MPRKRPLDVRLAEAEDKLEQLRLEKAIADMRIRVARRRPRRRSKR